MRSFFYVQVPGLNIIMMNYTNTGAKMGGGGVWGYGIGGGGLWGGGVGRLGGWQALSLVTHATAWHLEL